MMINTAFKLSPFAINVMAKLKDESTSEAQAERVNKDLPRGRQTEIQGISNIFK